MLKLATLQSSVRQLPEKKRNRNEAFSKYEFTANRPLSGSMRQKRAARLKQQAKYTCACCKRITQALEIDHIIPLSQGGGDDDGNLQVLCCDGDNSCHRIKTALESKFQTVTHREIRSRQKS